MWGRAAVNYLCLAGVMDGEEPKARWLERETEGGLNYFRAGETLSWQKNRGWQLPTSRQIGSSAASDIGGGRQDLPVNSLFVNTLRLFLLEISLGSCSPAFSLPLAPSCEGVKRVQRLPR